MTPEQLQGLIAAFRSLTTAASATTASITKLASTPFEQLNRAISAVQSQIVSLVSYANPAAVMRFQMAWEDLQGVLGRILMPILNSVTLIVQELANYINAASGPAKGLILVLGGVGVATATVVGLFAGLTAAMVVFQVVTAAATGGLSAIAGAIGGILGAVTAGGAVGAGLALALSPLKKLQEIIEKIGNVATRAFDQLGTAIFPVLEAMVDGFMNALGPLSNAFTAIVAAMGPVISIIGSVVSNITNWFVLAIQVFAGQLTALKPILDLVAGVIGGLAAAFSMFTQFASPIIAGLFRFGAAIGQLILSPFTALMGVFQAFSPVIRSIQSLFGAVGNAIGSVLGALGNAIGSLASSAFSLLGTALKALEPLIIRLAVYIEALAMVIDSIFGQHQEEQKAPGRAPPAVRQATSGNIQSFITKAYVSAFQAGGGAEDPFKSKVKTQLEEIKIAAQATARDIYAFLARAEATGQAASNAAGATSKFAQDVTGISAARSLMMALTGK